MIVASQAAEIQTSAYAPKDPAESAILATLPPGSYTVIVRGVNATAYMQPARQFQDRGCTRADRRRRFIRLARKPQRTTRM